MVLFNGFFLINGCTYSRPIFEGSVGIVLIKLPKTWSTTGIKWSVWAGTQVNVSQAKLLIESLMSSKYQLSQPCPSLQNVEEVVRLGTHSQEVTQSAPSCPGGQPGWHKTHPRSSGLHKQWKGSEGRDSLAAGWTERCLGTSVKCRDRRGFDQATHIKITEAASSLGSVSLVTVLRIAVSWSLYSFLLYFSLFTYNKEGGEKKSSDTL